MRSITKLVLVLSLHAFVAHAQTSAWVESQNMIAAGKVTPQMNFYATSPLTKNTGLFAWTLVRGTYAEGIVGGTFAPNPNVEFYLGGGLENAPQPWRVQGSVFAAAGKVSSFTVLEEGGSGLWYVEELKVSTPNINTVHTSIGLRAQRFIGVGPRLEAKFARATVWLVPLTFDIEGGEGRHGVASVRFAF